MRRKIRTQRCELRLHTPLYSQQHRICGTQSQVTTTRCGALTHSPIKYPKTSNARSTIEGFDFSSALLQWTARVFGECTHAAIMAIRAVSTATQRVKCHSVRQAHEAR